MVGVSPYNRRYSGSAATLGLSLEDLKAGHANIFMKSSNIYYRHLKVITYQSASSNLRKGTEAGYQKKILTLLAIIIKKTMYSGKTYNNGNLIFRLKFSKLEMGFI